jgi:dynein heavy chain
VAVVVDAVSKKAAEIGAVKDDAESDLSAAKPALDEALAALNSITQKDIVSLKALKSPPDIVKRIFDAVLLLRYWPIDKVRKGSHVQWSAGSSARTGLSLVRFCVKHLKCNMLNA